MYELECCDDRMEMEHIRRKNTKSWLYIIVVLCLNT